MAGWRAYGLGLMVCILYVIVFLLTKISFSGSINDLVSTFCILGSVLCLSLFLKEAVDILAMTINPSRDFTQLELKMATAGYTKVRHIEMFEHLHPHGKTLFYEDQKRKYECLPGQSRESLFKKLPKFYRFKLHLNPKTGHILVKDVLFNNWYLFSTPTPK